MSSRNSRKINLDDLKDHVEHLKTHNNQQKVPISICGRELLNFCKRNAKKDFLVDQKDKENPFITKSNCIFLF